MKITITVSDGKPIEITKETLERILSAAEIILNKLKDFEPPPVSDYIALDMINKLKYKLWDAERVK